MNWLFIVRMDWNIYQDPQRIKNYVEKEKITAQEYTDITGQPYEGAV